MKKDPVKIHILGAGITAQAVHQKVEQHLDLFQVVDLDAAEIVVVSPGTPPREWPKVSGQIMSEIEFTFRFFVKNPVIAITGTNGKSTTTALVAHGLGVEPLGNIGKPFISGDFNDAWHVVEVSSFQLEATQTFKPFISVLLNLGVDHLDWHEGLENYHLSKLKIFKNQNKDDFTVYNADDSVLSGYIPQTHANKIAFKTVLGENPNYTAAEKVLTLCGQSRAQIEKAFQSFKGLSHRLEKIENEWGVEIYNDSKATNPESTCFALDQMKTSCVLILGGQDKKTSLQALSQKIRQKVSRVILYGEAAQRFFSELNEFSPQKYETLEQAVDAARKLIQPGEILLFSPACASFDQFQNFEQRGHAFVKLVQSATK